MFDFIASVLAAFYELPVVGGSFGLAIIMLTIAVMIVLMPLTLKATRSTIKMQQVQPQLKKLQKEHKDDREALNRELMALYQENGINPVGGCVPMLAQLPVFLVLFNVLRGLSRRQSDRSFFEVANDIREQTGLEAMSGESFNPKYVSPDTELYQDLSASTEMTFGPFDLAERAIDVLRSDFLAAIPYVLLIVFVVFSSYYQQRQVSARRGSDPSPMNQQQQMLLRTLPLLSGVWSFLFPAGLVVYWATSNVFRIGQQSYITRQIYHKEGAAEVLEAVRKASDEEDTSSKSKQKKADGGGKGQKQKNAGGQGKKKSADASQNGSSNGSKETAGSSSGESDDGEATSAEPSKTGSRAEQWEARRKQKAAVKRSRSQSGSGGSTSSGSTSSSRITPKGTSPSQNKKKRKK